MSAMADGVRSMETGELREAVLRMLPPGVAFAIWEGDGSPAECPGESTALLGAVPARATEFRRGRACARDALAQLGAPPAPLPVGPGRAPVWPAGFVGSITHCRGLVAAVAATSHRYTALGLDAEPAGSLPAGTRHFVLHPVEREGRDGLATDIDKVVFSAKESIFKALFPFSGVWLGFHDVIVEVDPSGRRFSARPAPDASAVAPRIGALQGRCVIEQGLVVTACFLEAP